MEDLPFTSYFFVRRAPVDKINDSRVRKVFEKQQ